VFDGLFEFCQVSTSGSMSMFLKLWFTPRLVDQLCSRCANSPVHRWCIAPQRGLR